MIVGQTRTTEGFERGVVLDVVGDLSVTLLNLGSAFDREGERWRSLFESAAFGGGVETAAMAGPRKKGRAHAGR